MQRRSVHYTEFCEYFATCQDFGLNVVALVRARGACSGGGSDGSGFTVCVCVCVCVCVYVCVCRRDSHECPLLLSRAFIAQILYHFSFLAFFLSSLPSPIFLSFLSLPFLSLSLSRLLCSSRSCTFCLTIPPLASFSVLSSPPILL